MPAGAQASKAESWLQRERSFNAALSLDENRTRYIEWNISAKLN